MQFDLGQHVDQSTHVKGGHLDLVITSDNDQVNDLTIILPTLSNHSVIKFTLPSVHFQPIHSTIHMMRGWKSFDSQVFSVALRQRFSTCGPRPTGGPRTSAWWAANKVGN